MQLDLDALHSELISGLPKSRRWELKGLSFDYDFTIGYEGLGPETNDAMVPSDLDRYNLYYFGEYTYNEGGGSSGWLGICATDGAVYILDLALANPLSRLNSSMGSFIRTFRELDQYLSDELELPADVDSRLQLLDPATYNVSDWKG